MPAICLQSRAVERVWGRRGLGGAASGAPIGEIWHEGGEATGLLVKQLFTSARLSIQVHPGEAAAQAAGLPGGKDEAWLVLAAEPGATIGLGLRREASREELRAAALDGGIEHLVAWRQVRPGDFLFVPAGTIHAIGAGIALVEVQQASDVTYRLYDYGRPRALHLDEALAVAHRRPWRPGAPPELIEPGRTLYHEGGAFAVERWRVSGPARARGPLLLVPLIGGRIDGAAMAPGSVWLATGECRIEDADLLVAYPGAAMRPDALWRAAPVTAWSAGSKAPEMRVSPA